MLGKSLLFGIAAALAFSLAQPLFAQSAPGDVLVGQAVVMRVRFDAGGVSARDRAVAIMDRIHPFLGEGQFDPASVRVQKVGADHAILIGNKLIATADTRTAAANRMTTRQLADLWAANLARAILQFKSTSGQRVAFQETAMLEGNTWRAIAIGDKAVIEPQGRPDGVHIVLDAKEKRFSGSGGINRIMGGYKLSGSSLAFTAPASTMMAGPQELMDQEVAFLKALEKAASYKIAGETMRLFDKEGKELVRFVTKASAIPEKP